ncbi:MAG: hypothetical protein GXP27_16305 [Planctomycetes bacterium]|nr:hypothetical protein [Planctomycetota bacterium]
MATELLPEKGETEEAEALSSHEAIVLTRYPSVASTRVCRALGCLYELLPRPKINGVKLSHLLFTLPTSPIPAVVYFVLKVFGDKYVLTDRSIQRRKALTNRLVKTIPLIEVAEIDVHQSCGQVFYKAGDLILRDSAGQELMTLEGVVRPDVFRHNILQVRDALLAVKSSLAAIRTRGG